MLQFIWWPKGQQFVINCNAIKFYLQPENLLLKDPTNDAGIKIGDYIFITLLRSIMCIYLNTLEQTVTNIYIYTVVLKGVVWS